MGNEFYFNAQAGTMGAAFNPSGNMAGKCVLAWLDIYGAVIEKKHRAEN